jgi:hypothetical protein
MLNSFDDEIKTGKKKIKTKIPLQMNETLNPNPEP